jgi:hypothetical protein
MSRKLALVAVIVAVYLASLPGAALGAPPSQFPAGSSGIGDPYFPLDGNGGYDVEHYDLKVSYDPATDRLTGEATIRARATQNLSAFNLDFVGLRLRSLTVNGTSATSTRKGQELTVKPRAGLTNGSTFTVVARYDGVPQTLEEFGLSGFIHTDDGAIVIGEPHVAATWFPANDHPRDKAAFTFAITVPTGIEAISNGVLIGQQTTGASTTWTWDAVEPMTTYLAMMAIGQFDVRAYQAGGIKYWDAIDTAFMGDLRPALTPIAGEQFLYSQIGEPAYKRVSHVVDVPAGGANLTFQVNRDTEPGWDFLFVESRTAGGTDWTTLPDANGHTSQDVGACPFFLDFNPFLDHYLTPIVVNPNDPGTPDDDELSCDPVGTTGVWHAASGASDGWETWSIPLANTGATTRQVEVSITYASDGFIQGQGVTVDDVVVSTGQGTTSFEADGNTLDGWTTPAAPAGSEPNPNTWATSSFVPAVPGLGASALVSFDRQPEIIAFEAGHFGPYPFSAAGGIVDDASVGFALENQTRPTYSPFFFGAPEGNDFVVVHELAHQWYGDSLAVDAWQHIWLNEGFATYAEWLWSEQEGFGTTAEIFDSFAEIPADDEFFWGLAIGDPGPNAIFEFPVYARGAMTLEALRQEVGDRNFFRILKAWSSTQAGGNVTTREFIDLAESFHRKDLDPLFDMWLSAGKPDIDSGHPGPRGLTVRTLPPAARSLVERLHDRKGQPFKDATGKGH